MDKVLVVYLENIEGRMTTDAVYNFMKFQNRPYSANDIASALDKEKHGKNSVQKSLDKLVDKEKLFVKTYGKQKVYCIIQEAKQNMDELKRIERELKVHSNEQVKKLKELEYEVRTQETLLNSLKCSMSLEEAKKERDRLQQNNDELSSKLDEVMEASGTEDMSEIKKKTEASVTVFNREYSKRKRICNDILDCILESYPGSKNQLFTEIGINVI